MLNSSIRSGNLLVTLGLSFGALLTSYIVYLKLRAKPRKFNRSKEKSVVPKSWKHIGKIKSLYIYPLKSGHYVQVERAFCADQGMKLEVKDGCLFDRSFILFNETEKMFISSKQYNHLILVKTDYKGGGMFEFSVYNQPNYEKLTVNISNVLKANNTKSFKLYVDETLSALDCGDAASVWFSNYLTTTSDSSIRLGFSTTGKSKRNIHGNHMSKYTTVYDNVNDEDLGVFADMTSFMILNENSLVDLNGRMDDIGVPRVTMPQFRGNIIVDGPAPFVEDSWDWLRFNDQVVMRVVKPCTRCVLTCVHPDTGIKRTDLQPFMTLKQYRAVPDEVTRKVENHAPMFGQYAGVHRTGYVRLGDDVYVGCET